MKKEAINTLAVKYVELLEGFNGKWENPVIDFRAINNFSKKSYRGVNMLLLSLVTSLKQCNKYGTFKQWTEAGFRIKKGAKGLPVVFWKAYEKEIEEKEEGKEGQEEGKTNTLNEEEGNKEKKKETFLVARLYTVFNGADVEGFNNYQENIPANSFDPAEVEKIEAFFNSIEGLTITRNLTSTAFYNPITDTVNVPPTQNYKKLIELCSSFAHEVAHSTGHQKRLNRDLSGHFGDENYAKEELIAEITAGMVAGELGYPYMFNSQILAYLASWLKAIRTEKSKEKLLLNACKQAQEATDWILAHSNLKLN